jgi:hypothetical protein
LTLAELQRCQPGDSRGGSNRAAGTTVRGTDVVMSLVKLRSLAAA